jgi:2-polyprenyl-3-methyl-5-hydroxy-6-metoxy-1,4-benzoquinol methylase
MKTKQTWGDFYEGAGGVDYFIDHLAIHKEFLKNILDRKPQKVLEAGCGSAIMSIFFAMAGIEVTACDRDDEVLKKASENAARWNARVKFEKKDLMSLDYKPNSFDVVFSQGVLEHMTDAEIQASSREILKAGKTFIFSVPSFYYKHKDFGNERLLKEGEWTHILKPVGKLELKYYYPLRVKRNFLIKRPLMLMGILSR